MRVRDLTKTYGNGPTRVDAVHELDLDVHRGEVLLVMGPSGSGKTTLLLMIGGLLRPTSGSIQVFTRDGTTADLAVTPEWQLPSLRAHTFGFIFQDYALLDALTATENIAVATNLAGLRGSRSPARWPTTPCPTRRRTDRQPRRLPWPGPVPAASGPRRRGPPVGRHRQP